MYVAHTRPQKCLHIITNGNSKNYGTFLKKFTEKQDNIFQYAENENVFFIGDINYKNTKRKKTIAPDLPLHCFHTSNFLPGNRGLLFSFFNEKTKEQEHGIALHELLSSLTSFPKTTTEIDEMLIDKDEKTMLKSLLLKTLKDEELYSHFSDEAHILHETYIVDTDGVRYRPDRISMIHDEVLIVDYKTGKENPKYKEQLNYYVSLLQEMGYERVKGRLLYI